MSHEDQSAVIVRLLQERTQLQKEVALAKESLREYNRTCMSLAMSIDDMFKGAPGLAMARSAARKLADSDGPRRILELLHDLESLPRRIAEIEQTLKDSGIVL